ncbi:MAG TPA: DUF4276 family protein [Nostocaceae cyanobacterium]|nr:DUF4276 family protein [Nostocaceae cyanobacterium]
MIRLYLFAEGQTEQTFADNMLKPHLSQYSIFMDKIMLISHTRKKGTVHRGGGKNYEAMKNDILRFIKQEKSPNVFFTTMIDLYAISTKFPGLDEAEKLRQNPIQRVEFLENSFAQDIDDRHFIPYIQMHEYEAYLFSNPTCFEQLLPRDSKKVEVLKAIAEKYDTPELINDSPQTAPSKRIISQFPDYEKDKVRVGSQLAESIGLEIIRGKCPHFNAWLSKLESLNQEDNNG